MQLDDLRKDLDSKFNTFKIEVGEEEFVFRSSMRMSKVERKNLKGALETFQKFLSDESTSLEDAEPIINGIVEKLVAGGKGKRLLRAIGDDIALTISVVSEWIASTSPGEASGSPNSSTTTASSSSATSTDSTEDRSSTP